jgi:TonB family protein
MRPIVAASILLSPMLLAASAVASSPKADAPAPTEYNRTTKAVALPASLEYSTFHLPAGSSSQVNANDAKVVLSLNVDQKGNARNIRVVKSANPELNNRVVQAISQAHFNPATVNHQPVAVDVNITVNVQQ